MSRPSSPSRRREQDVMKLMLADFAVELVNDNINEFIVDFVGPKDSPYEGGTWKVHVELPESYPYKSPSIGFVGRIFHPNIDLGSGTVCLDVINQTWSPMFDLINIFEVFLPQLLLYPNPTDPLNGEAAALLMRDPPAYNARVKDLVQRYAKPGGAATAAAPAAANATNCSSRASDSGRGAAAAGAAAPAARRREASEAPADPMDQDPARGDAGAEEEDEEGEEAESEGGFLSSSEEEED